MTIACVIDSGAYVELAIALQKHFDRVLYVSPWITTTPTSNQTIIGKGVVEVVDSIWPYLSKIDVCVFPDLFYGHLQTHLAEMGMDVWGAREAENLEIHRVPAKKFMAELGIEIGPYEVVKGTDELRKYLKGNPDKFVKVSKTRGDFETFHARNAALAEQWIDELEYRIGPKKTFMEFIVEEPINPATEVGFDGYCIDGEFSTPITGIEIKDGAYLGRASPLPPQAQDINDKLSPFFKETNYRGFFCSEVRIKDGIGYMIDPCCRMPSPPGYLMIEWIKNLAEIIDRGSAGEMVDPQFAGEWGAELVLSSEWSNDKWQPIDIPEEFRDNVKLSARVRVEGKDYVVPGYGVGGIVAVSDSPESAIGRCKEIAPELNSYGLTYTLESLDKALEEFDKLPKASPKPKGRPQDDSLASALSRSPKMKGLSETLSEALE